MARVFEEVTMLFKKRKIIAIVFGLVTMIAISSEAAIMETEWFQTWDRPEYLEWAKQIPEGYLLHIVRKESGNFLVVQAKLIMGETGLPGFEVVQQCNAASESEALQIVEAWREERLLQRSE